MGEFEYLPKHSAQRLIWNSTSKQQYKGREKCHPLQDYSYYVKRKFIKIKFEIYEEQRHTVATKKLKS